jgi:hypothetical protein
MRGKVPEWDDKYIEKEMPKKNLLKYQKKTC